MGKQNGRFPVWMERKSAGSKTVICKMTRRSTSNNGSGWTLLQPNPLPEPARDGELSPKASVILR